MQWGKRTIEEFRRASGALPGLIACSCGNSLRAPGGGPPGPPGGGPPGGPPNPPRPPGPPGGGPPGPPGPPPPRPIRRCSWWHALPRVLELVVRKPGGLFILGHRGLFQLSARIRERGRQLDPGFLRPFGRIWICPVRPPIGRIPSPALESYPREEVLVEVHCR